MPRLEPAAKRGARLRGFVLALVFLGHLFPAGPGPAAADPPPPDAPATSSQDGFLARHRRSLLIATASGAAAAGITAIFYRRAANDRYDEYQETADPDAIADLYAETAHLDHVAAGFFIAGEALFVAAIYLGFFVETESAAHAGLAAGVPLGAQRFLPQWTVSAQGNPRIGLEWRF